jgi:hypothetical protein
LKATLKSCGSKSEFEYISGPPIPCDSLQPSDLLVFLLVSGEQTFTATSNEGN